MNSERPRRRATLADVATAAGVSLSTASIAFSGTRPVTPATARRVVDAAHQLGYNGPDPIAASLRTGRSGIVGVVIDQHLRTAFLDPVMIQTMDGLAEGLSPLNAGMLLLRDDPAGIASPTLAPAPVDAVVLIGNSSRSGDSLGGLRSRGVPIVAVEGDRGLDIPHVDLNNREAQRQGALHLQQLGHALVAIVTLPGALEATDGHRQGSMESVSGCLAADRLLGAWDVFPSATTYPAAASSIDEGLAVARVALATLPPPTAIIAQSDLLAAGVIRAAVEIGLSIPRDLSVIGFDGVAVDGLGPFLLTTLVQPAAEKGRYAAAAIATMLDGHPASSHTLSCIFREGNTTALPPN